MAKTMTNIRIQKTLAEAGVASRRTAEQMILDGRITVNGQLVMKLPCFVDPRHDDIRLDNKPVRKSAARKVYVLLNKPRGVSCTQRDPRGRPVAADLVSGVDERIYCVGGLDEETTGLVVLTNDGEMTQHLTHGGMVRSTYLVELDGGLSEQDAEKLRAGMYFDGKKTPPVKVKTLRGTANWGVLEIEIVEGRNPRLRRMLARLGRKVLRLKRTAVGPLTERGLKIGHWRMLSDREVRHMLPPERRSD